MPYGGLFSAGADGNDDFGAIASRAAEQLANTRAASQGQQAKTAEDIAKRPQPTRSVSIVENPDGTVTHTTTVKNAPPRDPATAIQSAGNEPYADFAHRVLSQGAQLGQESLDRLQKTHDSIDETLSSRAGRVAVAKELGVRDPADVPGEFFRNGVFGYRQKRQAYEDLISNPSKLKEAILAKQFNEADKFASTLRPLSQDERSQDREDRAQGAEERRIGAAAETERHHRQTEQQSAEETFIGDFARGDHNYGFMDEKAAGSLIDAEKQRFKARFGADKEMPPWMESIMRSRIADDRAKTAHTEALESTRQANQDRTYARLLNKQDKPPRPRKLPEGSGVDAVIEAMDDEEVDQPSLRRTTATHLNKFADDMNKNIADARILDRQIKILASAVYLTDSQKSDLEKKRQQRANLADKNQRLYEDKERLRNAARSHGYVFGRNAPSTSSAPPAAGQLLSKDDALRKLQQQP